MSKLTFGTEEQGVAFAQEVQGIIQKFTKGGCIKEASIIRQLLTDNIRLFNRVKELENAEPSREEEQ